MIKTVAFDFGGVISFPPLPQTMREMEELTMLPAARLDELNLMYRKEYYDRGIYDSVEYHRFILSQAGIFPDDECLRRIAQTDMGGYKRMDTAAVQLMRDIKAAGFTLAILSNMPSDFLVWGRENIPVFSEADVAIFSCEHKVVKPETAIYEKLRAETHSAYTEIVFFDDLKDNITKAGELGIWGFVWAGAKAARETLQNLDKAFEVL